MDSCALDIADRSRVVEKSASWSLCPEKVGINDTDGRRVATVTIEEIEESGVYQPVFKCKFLKVVYSTSM
jgi:hypothetical protein